MKVHGYIANALVGGAQVVRVAPDLCALPAPKLLLRTVRSARGQASQFRPP
jgi:hypothetical protein